MPRKPAEVEARHLEGGRAVVLPEPMPHQQGIILHPARFKVLICGRRYGKSWAGRPMALVGHGPTCTERRGALYGGYVWWVMPAMPQARTTWDAFEYALRDIWVRKNATEKFFDLPGGGRFQIKSSDEPDSLRGDGLTGIVLDEVKDHDIKAWKALRPTLADNHGWLLAMGTAGDPVEEDLSFYLAERAKNRRGWKLWQEPSSANPIVTPAELADMRDELGPFGFERECLAQFVAASGGMFKREWFKYYDEPERGTYAYEDERVEWRSLERFVAADLAITAKTHSDFTAAVVIGRAPSGRLYVLDLVHQKIESPRVVPMLSNLMQTSGALELWLEAAGAVQALNLEAKEKGLPVVEVALTKDILKKEHRAQPLSAAVESGRIVFPRSAPWLGRLILECCSFPDPAVNDDIVDALSLSVLASPPMPPPGEREADPDPFDDHDEGWSLGARANRPWWA